jgi:hypothetical protein
MNSSSQFESHPPLRQLGYMLLITLSLGQGMGRILSTELVLEPSLHRPPGPAPASDTRRIWSPDPPIGMPTFSSNDRVRWATVRALVQHGTYEIGKRTEFPPVPGMDVPTHNVILLGRLHAHAAQVLTGGPHVPFPPPVYLDSGILFENGYGSVDRILHPERKSFYASKPPLLPTLLAGLAWVLKASFGLTLEQHPWAVVRILLVVVNVLPWAIFLCLLCRLVDRLGITDWGRITVVAMAALGTYLSTFITNLNNHTIGAWSALFALYPLLMLKLEPDVQPKWWRFALAGLFAAWTTCNELPAASFGLLLFLWSLWHWPRQTLFAFVPAAALPVVSFLYTNYLAIGELMPAYEKFGSIWYNYPGSYWANKRGIDAANDPLPLYLFHLLLGHHGIFSLSPIFLLAGLGMLSSWKLHSEMPTQTMLQRMTLVLTVLLVLFYGVWVYYAQNTRNYGGWTCGPRWFFWLTPFWLLSMVPIVDSLSRSRLGRGIVYVLLFFSVLSVAYPAWNPWRHPWLYNLREAL